jgi:uncharacterized lipoprotein YbaY
MIVFDYPQPELSGATVYIRLEDTSLADAASQIVSKQVLADPAEHVTSEGIPFALPGGQTDFNPRRRYSVSVHIDMDSSGDVSYGDYISMESNPVLTFGHSDQVTVHVQ